MKDPNSLKFIAQLQEKSSSAESQFSIIETNSFKHIIHILLDFTAGNDLSIRKYLSGLVADSKQQSIQVQLVQPLSPVDNLILQELAHVKQQAESDLENLLMEKQTLVINLQSVCFPLFDAHLVDKI